MFPLAGLPKFFSTKFLTSSISAKVGLSYLIYSLSATELSSEETIDTNLSLLNFTPHP